jgi:orotidine-5'-phosphate decarboxylase
VSLLEPQTPNDRIIVALDGLDVFQALDLVDLLGDHVGGFKLGLEFQQKMLTSVATESPLEMMRVCEAYRKLIQRLAGKLMWDGKFHDIPNTMAGAIEALKQLRPTFVTVHASAGLDGVRKAVTCTSVSHIIGVTVLTSLSKEDCHEIYGDSPNEKVLNFADILLRAQASGIVCSPRELSTLKEQQQFKDLIRIVPGIRPYWASANDQIRVTTPFAAITNGADFLVIGRPITQPPTVIGSPIEAAEKIAEEILSAQQKG